MSEQDAITRREAIARTAFILGGTLAASTLAGAERAVWAAAAPGWRPRTLSAKQAETVATIAEFIIPTTDTPGARAAGVHRFVDVLLTDYYEPAERQRFLAGLADVDAWARRAHGATFLECSRAQQLDLVTAMDRAAYAGASDEDEEVAAAPSTTEQQKMRDSLARQASTSASVQPPSASADAQTGETVRQKQRGWFFRRMKELTLTGYYTSEVGATRELRVAPMGAYHGDIPYRGIGREWA